MAKYAVQRMGPPKTINQRFYVERNGIFISPWHDIPLFANKDDKILNMVVEIPRWTNTKFEIARNEPLNPIKQDIKDGKGRFVRNRFPYKGYIWNYGALPSTWENPSHVYPETGLPGDNDPLDACEIGEAVGYTGQVKQVKVLGLMALLDEGETDFKIIVLDVDDPLAPQVNDIADVEEKFPGLLDATRDWFRNYKVPDGKKPNGIGLNEEFKDKDFAFNIINHTAQEWCKLIGGEADPGKIALKREADAKEVQGSQNCEKLSPPPRNQDLEKWHFTESSKVKL